MNNKPLSVSKNSEDFDIKKLLHQFLSQWKLYILSIIIFLFVSFLFIRYATPLYKVHAKVLVQDEEDNSSSFMQSSMMQGFNGLFDVQSNVKNELAILQTRDLLKKVILKMQLTIGYYRKGNVRDVEIYTKSPFKINFSPVSDSVLLTKFEIDFPEKETSPGFTISGDNISFSAKGKFGDTINSP